MKRRERKNSLKLSKEIQGLFSSLFAGSSGDGRDVFAVFSEGGAMAGEGVCLNRSCENTPCNNLSEQLAS